MAVLLTWNPARNRPSLEEIGDLAVRLRSGRQAVLDWSCGNARYIRKGTPFFFLRQGRGTKGIVGAGTITKGSFRGQHWEDRRRGANYVSAKFHFLTDPERPKVPWAELHCGLLTGGPWSTQASGVKLTQETASALASRVGWRQMLATSVDEFGALEGGLQKRYVAHRARELRLRMQKIDDVLAVDRRLTCEVPGCGFDFERTYGELGKHYAHVHHKEALSSRKRPKVTRLVDLAIVCANCHAMIHRGGECRKLAFLGARVRQR